MPVFPVYGWWGCWFVAMTVVPVWMRPVRDWNKRRINIKVKLFEPRLRWKHLTLSTICTSATLFSVFIFPMRWWGCCSVAMTVMSVLVRSMRDWNNHCHKNLKNLNLHFCCLKLFRWATLWFVYKLCPKLQYSKSTRAAHCCICICTFFSMFLFSMWRRSCGFVAMAVMSVTMRPVRDWNNHCHQHENPYLCKFCHYRWTTVCKSSRKQPLVQIQERLLLSVCCSSPCKEEVVVLWPWLSCPCPWDTWETETTMIINIRIVEGILKLHVWTVLKTWTAACKIQNIPVSGCFSSPCDDRVGVLWPWLSCPWSWDPCETETAIVINIKIQIIIFRSIRGWVSVPIDKLEYVL